MTALVLGGGPDAEREVSIASATAVVEAMNDYGAIAAELVIIDAPDALDHLPGEVIVPMLHGSWGEGGPLQDILERDGRPYVGCGPRAARLCMDKLATKLVAASLGIPTPEAALVNRNDPVPSLGRPAVLKPVFEGSSVGLHLCHTEAELRTGWAHAAAQGIPMMVERMIPGREVTCGLLDTGSGIRPLPLVEIVPAEGVYDYAAKYDRDDTRYLVGDAIGPGVEHGPIQRDASAIAHALGLRHLARVDFMVDDRGDHWLLEVNTIPGFTGHSLLPKAAASLGITMGVLCTTLCELARREHSSQREDPVET